MQQKLNLINAVLALASMTFAALAALVWVQPKYPSRVDPRTVQPAPRTLESVTVERPAVEPGLIDAIVGANLFRKERTEYVPPPPPPPPQTSPAPKAPAAPQVAALPPPKVTLRGVLMANGTRVAFLEGKYPVRGANNQVQEKPLKRKGYFLGDPVGTFKIQSINKTQVTLANPQGSVMTVNMPRRSGDQVIQRQGNLLYHRDKKARERRKSVAVEKVIQPAPNPRSRVTPAPPTPRAPARQAAAPGQARAGLHPIPAPSPAPRPPVQGARPSPPQQQISGAPTPPPPAPHVSGAR